MIQVILHILILILGIPVGLLLKYLTRDEQKQGKKWFFVLLTALIILLIVNLFVNYELRTIVRLSL